MEIMSLDPIFDAELSLSGNEGDYGPSASLEPVDIGVNNRFFVQANPDLMLLRLACTDTSNETWTVTAGASRMKDPYAKPD